MAGIRARSAWRLRQGRAAWWVLLALFGATFGSPSGPAFGCERASPAEVESLVGRAAELIETSGLQVALHHLLAPGSEYRRGELYVFVIDRRGVLRANARGGAAGMDLTGTRDAKGRYFVKEMLHIAKRRGAGWLSYEWLDPCTGRMAEKQTYVKRAGEYIVAAGIYRIIRV